MAWTYLAVDLGASSGRVISGWMENEKIVLSEEHRFENVPIRVGESLCWDFDRLMSDILKGLEQAFTNARKNRRPVRSIGIDSWAVDFGLTDVNGKLTGPVVHYRDGRTIGQMDKVFNRISRERLFEITAIQFLPFNTIYQLAALKELHPEQLENARHFMMIADLVAWKLTGEVTCEFTNASTTQLLNCKTGEWSSEIIDCLGLPNNIFPNPVQPTTAIGSLKPEYADAWAEGQQIDIVAVATHDTGSAVVGVPAGHNEFAYLSCGTWSLLGTEIREPANTREALAENFTSEGGAFNTFRLLKNIMGLWILQESRREWQKQSRDYTWAQLEKMARDNAEMAAVVDVDDPRFLAPGDMVGRLIEYCTEHKLAIPSCDGEIVACILKSLAHKYRDVLSSLESLSGFHFDSLHIVGGGVQNRLLCEWTARAIGRPVWAGPIEATACGNLGVQMIAAGELRNLEDLRNKIGRSFPVQKYEPEMPT